MSGKVCVRKRKLTSQVFKITTLGDTERTFPFQFSIFPGQKSGKVLRKGRLERHILDWISYCSLVENCSRSFQQSERSQNWSQPAEWEAKKQQGIWITPGMCGAKMNYRNETAVAK